MKQFVAFSGGKDSTTLALLRPEATPVFTDTKWEFPELYAHLDKFEQVTSRKVIRIVHPEYSGGLPEYIYHHSFMPGHGSRYCTRIFKIDVFNYLLKANLPCELLIGLRADEEDRTGNQTVLEGLTIRYPLREQGLTAIDCIRICAEHDLLPRYPIYMARGGCKGCFYKRKSEVKAMNALVPDILDELQELEEGVQDERGKFAYMFPNIGMSIKELRQQSSLFVDPEEVYRQALDKSDVGVACGLFCNR